MNLIWTIIIIICIIFGIINNNQNDMIEGLFNVPKDTIMILLKIGGIIVILSGVFNIAIASGVIDFLSKPIKKFVCKIFNIKSSSISSKYICANIIANLLGLSIASMPLAIKGFEEMKKEKQPKENYLIFVLLNISCFTLFPITFITIRNEYNSKKNIVLTLIFILITGITSLLVILISLFNKRVKKNE